MNTFMFVKYSCNNDTVDSVPTLKGIKCGNILALLLFIFSVNNIVSGSHQI